MKLILRIEINERETIDQVLAAISKAFLETGKSSVGVTIEVIEDE